MTTEALELDFWPRPTARRDDPVTSHLAAAQAAPGNGVLVTAIRSLVAEQGPQTAFQIAAGVEQVWPGRWQADTIRTACARAGLVEAGHVLRRGRPVILYGLGQS